MLFNRKKNLIRVLNLKLLEKKKLKTISRSSYRLLKKYRKVLKRIKFRKRRFLKIFYRQRYLKFYFKNLFANLMFFKGKYPTKRKLLKKFYTKVYKKRKRRRRFKKWKAYKRLFFRKKYRRFKKPEFFWRMYTRKRLSPRKKKFLKRLLSLKKKGFISWRAKTLPKKILPFKKISLTQLKKLKRFPFFLKKKRVKKRFSRLSLLRLMRLKHFKDKRIIFRLKSLFFRKRSFKKVFKLPYWNVKHAKRARRWAFKRKKRRRRKNKYKYNFKGKYKRKKKKKYLKPFYYVKFIKKLFIFNLGETFLNKKYKNPRKYFYYQLLNNLKFNLMFILNSANFLNNYYYLRHFIKQGNVLINGIVITNPFFLVKIWDIITLTKKTRKLIARRLAASLIHFKKLIFKTKHQFFYVQKANKLFFEKKSAKTQLFQHKKKWKTSKFSKKFTWYLIKKRRNLMFRFPKYMEVSYKLCSIIILRKPKIKELYIPFALYNPRSKTLK